MPKPTADASDPVPQRFRVQRRVRLVLLASSALGLNLLAYLLLTPERIAYLGTGGLGYLGAFGVAGIANASVILPVPYYPVIARLGQVFAPEGIVVAAAAGSALGEAVAFFVGRAGRGAAVETRFYQWARRQMDRRWRAALLLFLLSAPPNPAFDVAGLLAGALGIPLWLFLLMVFLGRIIRMGLVVFVGVGLAGENQ